MPSVESTQYDTTDPNLTHVDDNQPNENANAVQHSPYDKHNVSSSPSNSQAKLDGSFNNSDASSLGNKAKPPLPPKPKASGQGSSNSGESTTENSPEAQRSPKLPDRNPRGTGSSTAKAGNQGSAKILILWMNIIDIKLRFLLLAHCLGYIVLGNNEVFSCT